MFLSYLKKNCLWRFVCNTQTTKKGNKQQSHNNQLTPKKGLNKWKHIRNGIGCFIVKCAWPQNYTLTKPMIWFENARFKIQMSRMCTATIQFHSHAIDANDDDGWVVWRFVNNSRRDDNSISSQTTANYKCQRQRKTIIIIWIVIYHLWHVDLCHTHSRGTLLFSIRWEIIRQMKIVSPTKCVMSSSKNRQRELSSTVSGSNSMWNWRRIGGSLAFCAHSISNIWWRK